MCLRVYVYGIVGWSVEVKLIASKSGRKNGLTKHNINRAPLTNNHYCGLWTVNRGLFTEINTVQIEKVVFLEFVKHETETEVVGAVAECYVFDVF